MISLPRQARDKHRESTSLKKTTRAVFLYKQEEAPYSTACKILRQLTYLVVPSDMLYCLWCARGRERHHPIKLSTDSFLSSSMRQNGIFEPFKCKNDHFAKTGSGQNIGKTQKKMDPFFIDDDPGGWVARFTSWLRATRPRTR